MAEPAPRKTASDNEKDRLAQQNGSVGTATEPAESGAIMEDSIKATVPMEHPAVDSEPRKGLPAASNRIDFNDPTLDRAPERSDPA